MALNWQNETRSFFENGWCQFVHDDILLEWIDHALPAARATTTDVRYAEWHRSGGTWFAGVNALNNNTTGALRSGPSLSGHAVSFIRDALSLEDVAWDRAQVSICYPGYPKPMESESDAAFRYRIKRDAAHVDGIRRIGKKRRRFLLEHHAFILGIPMVPADSGASPFVIWEGSHHIVKNTLKHYFDELAPNEWCTVDITDVYQETRRRIFSECQRVEIHTDPGVAYIAHRLSLHGIAPWRSAAVPDVSERTICYFRPPILDPWRWLNDP